MPHRLPMLIAAALALCCRVGGPASAQPMPNAAGAAAQPRPVAPVDRQMMAGMATMQRQMAGAPMNGQPDHDFVSMMIPHHQGAVAMAQTELRDGHDPQMRALARSIIADQDREIAAMQAWLRAHPDAR